MINRKISFGSAWIMDDPLSVFAVKRKCVSSCYINPLFILLSILEPSFQVLSDWILVFLSAGVLKLLITIHRFIERAFGVFQIDT